MKKCIRPSLLFLKALRKALHEFDSKINKNDDTFAHQILNDKLRKLPPDIWSKEIEPIPYDYIDAKPLKNKKIKSHPYKRFPKIPRELYDEYSRFFFDYENNKNDASEKKIFKDFSLSDLIDNLRCDLFTCVASELLFRRPEQYEKSDMSQFIEFKSKNTNINSMEVSDKKWISFRSTRNILTSRIKSIPMPPHFLMVYSDLKIDKDYGKRNFNPLYSFLVSDDVYDRLPLETYLEFERNIIFEGVEIPRDEILPKDGNRSPLLDFLTRSYIERTFGFWGVGVTINLLAQNRAISRDKRSLSKLINIMKLVKSDDMLFSKISFFNMLYSDYTNFIELFKAIANYFSAVVNKTLDIFSAEYVKNYGNKFSDLYNNLTSIYEDLFEKHVNELSQHSVSSDLSIENLTSEEKALIMKHIANPNNVISNINSIIMDIIGGVI